MKGKSSWKIDSQKGILHCVYYYIGKANAFMVNGEERSHCVRDYLFRWSRATVLGVCEHFNEGIVQIEVLCIRLLFKEWKRV